MRSGGRGRQPISACSRGLAALGTCVRLWQVPAAGLARRRFDAPPLRGRYEATIAQLRTDIRIAQGDIDTAKRDAQVRRRRRLVCWWCGCGVCLGFAFGVAAWQPSP